MRGGLKDLVGEPHELFVGHSGAGRREARGVRVAGRAGELHYRAWIRVGRSEGQGALREVLAGGHAPDRQRDQPVPLRVLAGVFDGGGDCAAALGEANGWLLFDQGKMSKSRGNIVRAETVHEVLGADALRYFLLREIPFGQDGNFSFDALVQRYNGDLANGYGNLVSRVVNMVHKYFGGVVPEAGAETAAEDCVARKVQTRAIAAFGPAFDELNFSEALKSLWTLVAETDGYLTANAPWKKPPERSDADHAKLQARVLATAAEAIRVITALVYPILPDAAAKVWRQLGQGEIGGCGEEFIFDRILRGAD